VKGLNLCYPGGAGGFLLLHLLLLSGRYHVIFGNRVPIDIDLAIGQQWKIVDHNRWKTREIWPNNDKTVRSLSELTKIYYYCYPWECKKSYSSYNVVLYTDFYSQFKMACFKKANWFCDPGPQLNDIKSRSPIWIEYYNKIREQSWPDCSCVSEINSLPVNIQNEIFDNPLTESVVKQVLSAQTQGYLNQQVCSELVPFLETADVTIKLQDLTNRPDEILKQVFDIHSVNRRQIDLLERWKNLHPPHLLTSIGISITRSQHEQLNTDIKST